VDQKRFKTYFANFCNKMNLPQPDSGPDSNIISPYCTPCSIASDFLPVPAEAVAVGAAAATAIVP
jgi:hypothetical protein